MNNRRILFLFVINIFLLTGCAETKVLERISISTLVGYDLEKKEDNKITTTLNVRQVSPDDKSSIGTQSNTADTVRGTRILANMATSKKIMSGQTRVVLFGKSYAEEGIENILHTLIMNPEISSSVFVAIVDGESKELIEGNYENITDIGEYLFNLLQHNIKQQHSVSSTLHEVVRNNYSGLRDMAIPILKKEENNIQLDSLAIFNKDKMVGKLTNKEAFYVIMLRDKFKAGTLGITVPKNTLGEDKVIKDELNVIIDSIKSKRTIKLVDSSTPEFDVDIDFGCRIVELHANANVGDAKVTKKLEKAIAKKMEEEISKTIKKTQEVNSDIFGFGDDYYATVRNSELTEKKWNQKYPQMKVNVNVKVQIIRDGVFE